MANLTTLENIPLSLKAELSDTVFLDPEPNFVYTKTAIMTQLKKGHGDTKRFPKYSRADAFTTPLPESELDIEPQVLAKTFIDAQIAYYGTYFLITERTVDQNPEDVLRVHADELNSALRKTEDLLTRDILLTTTASIPCVSGGNGDMPTQLSEKDLSTVIATLAGAIAKPIKEMIQGSNKIGTAPVAQAYMGITHPDLIPDLEAMDDFVPVEKYGSGYNPMDAEWGAYSRIRFVQTTQVRKDTGTSILGATVYNNLILGKDAFTLVKQGGENGTLVGPKKTGALEDKYRFGIKTAFTGALLFDQHVAKVTSTRSTAL